MLKELTPLGDKYFKIGAEKALLLIFFEYSLKQTNTINFTQLLQRIATNGTYLKRDLLKVSSIYFSFVLKEVKYTSPLLENIQFIDDPKNNMTWMKYTIPDIILELFSHFFYPLEQIKFKNIRSIYTLRFFHLLKSDSNMEVTLSKEYLFSFFKLPSSYRNRTNLILKFLNPLIRELEEGMEIKLNFKFYPEKSYEKIIFSLSPCTEEVEILEGPEEELTNPMDILLYDMFLKFKEEEQESILSTARDFHSQDDIQKTFEKIKKIYIVKALKSKNGL